MSELLLPEGWATASLGAIVELRYGKGLPQKSRRPGHISVYGSNGVVGRHDTPVTAGATIIVGRKGSVGEVHLSSHPCWPIDTTYFIDSFGPYYPTLLAHMLRWLKLAQNESSTAIPGLSRADAYGREAVIPPLSEQRRIVEKVEALLARVNAARDRLANVPAILKRFRQSVLAAACSGRLTEDWRVVSGRGGSSGDLPPAWTERAIADLASREPRSIQSGPFGSNLRHSEFTDAGVLVVGIDNVGDGVFLPGRQHRIRPQKYDELVKYTARPLDVLITVMATIGRCCVVPPDLETAIITKHVYRITTDKAVCSPRFLLCALRGAPEVRVQIREQVRGQTRPGINGEILKRIEIPLPPLDEQHEIVCRVDALMKLAHGIEGRLTAARARADRMAQVVLAKAFRGELVPTEAALARQERREYEPASELLDRIGRSRGHVGAPATRRRSRPYPRETAGPARPPR